MIRRTLSASACVFICLISFCGGCAKKPVNVAPAAPPAIPVSKPVTREVTDYIDFTGRTEAKNSVNIVPRVTGYLVSMPFREGADVKAGDVLFEIDPRPYQAQYDQASGQVLLNEARVKEAHADNLRERVSENARSDQCARYRSLSGCRGRSDCSRSSGEGQPRNLQTQFGILQRAIADRWTG